MQLADWLADPRNPLPARVMVNRLWQKLFGEGLVRSVDYFGARGEVPSHPELLDHLAARFQQDGWSIKRLLKSLVLSRTYRMASVNEPQAVQKDPDNRWLWRMNRQRLDSEAIRDGLLAVSGELQPCDGGPGLVLEEVENCGDLVQKGVNLPTTVIANLAPVKNINVRSTYRSCAPSSGHTIACGVTSISSIQPKLQVNDNRPWSQRSCFLC